MLFLQGLKTTAGWCSPLPQTLNANKIIHLLAQIYERNYKLTLLIDWVEISWGVPSLDLWKCLSHRKLSSETTSRDSKGSLECWYVWAAHVALFHMPWTHQPLLTAQFNILKLLCREMLCGKSLKYNGCVKQKKLHWGNSPKCELAKKRLSWKTFPPGLLVHWKFKQKILCSHLSLPILLSHSTTNTPTDSKGKGEIWVKSNTFPDPDNIPISYSSCNAGDIIPLANLQSFYSQSVKSRHIFPAWHFLLKTTPCYTCTHIHTEQRADYSWGFSFSCPDRCSLGQDEILHPQSWSCRADTSARLQAAAWLRFAEFYCPLRKNHSIPSDK